MRERVLICGVLASVVFSCDPAAGVDGGTAGGTSSTGGGSSAGGSAGGSTSGGSTAGGSTAGGSTAGGSTAGGSTAGGSTAGGSTAGGSTAGGSTAGGSTAGGSTAGGSTAGGSTAGGSTAGGSTAGGSTAGGSTAGGSTAGGSTTGDAGTPLFLDRFEYDVQRDAGSKFVAGSPFIQAGWNYGKDAVLNGPGAGGLLYTTTSIPGFTGSFPGLNSTRVLAVEAKAGTGASCISPGGWCQTDFYLEYGDTNAGSFDTVPTDVWFQHWIYVADAAPQRSLFPPTSRLGKWLYPTRNSYPSSNLEWLLNLSGVMIDDETVMGGSGNELDIGMTSLAVQLNLTDTDGNIFTDGRAYALGTLGYAGTAPGRLTPMTANQWWLMRIHIDHSVTPGVVEMWIRPRNGAFVKTIDTAATTHVQWNPVNRTQGHRGFRFPTTMNNYYQNPTAQTTHGDWWIYIDDFAIARGVHAGGRGLADLPSYP